MDLINFGAFTVQSDKASFNMETGLYCDKA